MVGVAESDQPKWSRKLVRLPLTTGALLIYLSVVLIFIYLINKNNDYYQGHGFASLTSSLFFPRGNSKQKSYCLSREEISSYSKPSPHKPSADLQRINNVVLLGGGGGGRGGDHQMNHNGSSDRFSISTTECGYIVWRTSGGLGNQMMTIVSGFLYALLTNRVFLVEFGAEDANLLFCEPFHSDWSSSTSFSRSSSSTWILPDDFPHKKDGFQNLKNYFTSFFIHIYIVKEKLQHFPILRGTMLGPANHKIEYSTTTSPQT